MYVHSTVLIHQLLLTHSRWKIHIISLIPFPSSSPALLTASWITAAPDMGSIPPNTQASRCPPRITYLSEQTVRPWKKTLKYKHSGSNTKNCYWWIERVLVCFCLWQKVPSTWLQSSSDLSDHIIDPGYLVVAVNVHAHLPVMQWDKWLTHSSKNTKNRNNQARTVSWRVTAARKPRAFWQKGKKREEMWKTQMNDLQDTETGKTSAFLFVISWTLYPCGFLIAFFVNTLKSTSSYWLLISSVKPGPIL